MLTNQDILRIAMAQSALDLNCDAAAFEASENVVVASAKSPLARQYLQLPFFCQLVTYGSNVVASCDRAIMAQVKQYLDAYTWYHCFETPHLHVLESMLAPYGYTSCFMAQYYLPDLRVLHEKACPYPVRVLQPADFAPYYQPAWSNALCADRKHLDALAVGAYDGEKLIALAGASADCDAMWQIGIDVLPAYRRQGIASALTSRLALEVLEKGKVPFYCAAWSNVLSGRNAIASGFRPAWAELTAKTVDFVTQMNGKSL